MKSNLLLLISGIAIVLFYKGSYRIVENFVPDNMFNNILCIAISLILLFYLDGGLFSLGYCGKPDDEHFNKNIQKDNIDALYV
jgi:hypothetical protein